MLEGTVKITNHVVAAAKVGGIKAVYYDRI